MQRVVITLLLVMLVGSATPVLGKHRRSPEELHVFDYTPPGWQETIRLTVDRFNAVMPEGGPVLVYVSRAPRTCPPEREAADGIAVCWENSTEFGGLSTGERQGAEIVLMEKYTGEGDYERMACHEFMHVLTGIPNNHGALPDQSCVWGFLRELGPFDLQILTDEFTKQKRRTSSVNAYTDVDSFAAGADVAPGTDPIVADAAAVGDFDGDGLLDGDEAAYGTNPRIADSDGDGWFDGWEVSSGTDPLNIGSFPVG